MATDLRRTFRSRSAEETAALGEALGRRLGQGAVIALDGELGAGKTVFVQGLARGLGVEEPVTSPSFTLMHEHAGRLTLHHFDAWMTGREVAFLEATSSSTRSPSASTTRVRWQHAVSLMPSTR